MLFDEHFSRSTIQRWENSGPGGGGGDGDDNNNNNDDNDDNDDVENSNDDNNNNDDDRENWEFIEAFQWSQVFVRNKKIELAREEKNAEI